MKHLTRVYTWTIIVIAGTILLLLGAALWLRLPLLEDPTPWLKSSKGMVLMLSILLMASDVFIPVPSSILMTVNGVLFGIVGGAAVSLAGSVLAGLVGYGVGRAGQSLVNRHLSRAEQERVLDQLHRWGLFWVILSRPIPLLAETIAIGVGLARWKLKPFLLGVVAGNLPIALVYAITGALAKNWQTGLISFALVMLISGAAWFAGRKIQSRETTTRPT